MNSLDLYRAAVVVAILLAGASLVLGLLLDKAWRVHAERTGAPELPPFSLNSWVRNFTFFRAAAAIRPGPDTDGGLKLLLMAYKGVTWAVVAALPLLIVCAIALFARG